MNPGWSSPRWEHRAAPSAEETARPPPLLPSGWGRGEWGRFARVRLTLVNGSGIQLGKQTRRSLGAGRSRRRAGEEKRVFNHLRGPRFPSSRRGCCRFAQTRSGVPVGARRRETGLGTKAGRVRQAPAAAATTDHRRRPPTLRAAGASPAGKPLVAPPKATSPGHRSLALSSYPFREPFHCLVGPHYCEELQPQDAATTTTHTRPGRPPFLLSQAPLEAPPALRQTPATPASQPQARRRPRQRSRGNCTIKVAFREA